MFSGVLGDCPLVQAPQWGRVRERVLKDGTLQTVYSCEPGRRLKGHKILTCTADGWNHPIPKCVPHGKSNAFLFIRLDSFPSLNFLRGIFFLNSQFIFQLFKSLAISVSQQCKSIIAFFLYLFFKHFKFFQILYYFQI